MKMIVLPVGDQSDVVLPDGNEVSEDVPLGKNIHCICDKETCFAMQSNAFLCIQVTFWEQFYKTYKSVCSTYMHR